jgi:ferredoxin
VARRVNRGAARRAGTGRPALTGWPAALIERLAQTGLNAAGVADGAPYRALLPGCRSVLVFASGGGALWRHFTAAIRAEPAALTGEQHPLDAFVRRALERADPAPPASRRWIRCAADEPEPIDFRTLALRAGLGWPSALGLVLHPTWGPWLGLRAACFTREPLPPTPPPPGPGPCAGCAAPCATACPAGAVALPFRPGGTGGWQVRVCATWNAETGACARSCAAREACPVGAAHRYAPLERHYHQDRRSGRSALAAALGIADEREGIGPDWRRWAGPR